METTRRFSLGLLAGTAAFAGLPAQAELKGPSLDPKAKIARLWHGRTTAEKADEYRRYLYENGVKVIAKVPGNRGVQMMSDKTASGGEFMVISYWDSVEAIKGFAGENYTQVHDLPRDKEYLVDREAVVRHFSLDVDFRSI